LLVKVIGTLTVLPAVAVAGGAMVVVTSAVVAVVMVVLPTAVLLEVLVSGVEVPTVASTWTLPLPGAV
jgi:hypothetical protein